MGESIPPEPDTQFVTGPDGGSGLRAAARAEVSVRPAAGAPPQRIAERYLVREELGRGGLAVVYRVFDTVRERELALKQLALASTHPLFAEQSAAFEREYHTLVQLRHPRIIEVYDFGVDERGRYYTMELLAAGDLRERSPLPWRDACAAIYDVCSSLALLHSRGFVHCDVTPRNVRTAADGTAKLIDFGALLPMGPTTQVIGTPQFVPPEVLHRSSLDARTDLFSLGATLYYVLTARSPYNARRFSDLHAAWSQRPAAPSAVVAEIPPALDALVLSMVSVDPAARPLSAFEVMQRLAAIAGLSRDEVSSVSQAYLATPVLVGRDVPLAALRERIASALAGRGSSVLIGGDAGVGRSRMLDTCALDAKVAGALVLRANAGGRGDEALAVARALAEQLVQTLPELALASARSESVAELLFGARAAELEREGRPSELQPVLQPFAPGGDGAAVQSALTRWLLRVAARQPLAILVDDVNNADPASLAVLATLALSNARRRLLLIATAESGAPSPDVEAFAVLARECVALELPPLSEAQIEALASSLFGDVANLALVSHRLYQAALGNARETIGLVRSLIARETIRYEGGRWLLPEQLPAEALPSSAADSCRDTVAALSPLARLLGQTHALASHAALGRRDYGLAAADFSSRELDAALSELLAQRVLSGDGRGYVLARREWTQALLARLDAGGDGEQPADARRDRHRRLAAVYAQDDARALERADHLLAAGEEASSLDLLVTLLGKAAAANQTLLANSKMTPQRLASLLDRALTSAERVGRRPRELHDLRHALVSISIATDEALYLRAAPAWFAQLAHDSGLALHQALGDVSDPDERLRRALTAAAERYAATPEHERVFSPELAIRGLAYYVVVSIAIGSRMQDVALLASLPAVLAPYAALSPALHAIWQNAIATGETTVVNQPEAAHRRWLAVLDALEKISSSEVSYVTAVRRAIIYGLGLIEARLGFASVEQRVRLLDDDPQQAVSAMSLRRIARLHQGDYAAAERHRKAAERLALHANVRTMFTSTLQGELIAHALAGDLTGIRQVADHIAPLAARHAGWRPFADLAEGYFEQIRGQPEAALAAFERGLRETSPPFGNAWLRLEPACMEVLLQLDRASEARTRGERALALCAEHGIVVSAFAIRRALALAEAKLGDYPGACARLEGVIADMLALGTSGLELGATYEARARIAIGFGDEPAIVAYTRHTAKEYRYGQGSSLGARYERLMDEARGRGVAALPLLEEFQTRLTTSHLHGASAAALIAHTLAGATNAEQRAERALRLLCDAHNARAGHLYLRGEDGLERVASLGESASDQGLDEFVRRHAQEQLASSEFATIVVGNDGSQTTATVCWTDPAGIPHMPLLLMAEVDGVKQCAGALALELGPSAALPLRSQHLLDAAGEYLLRAGDARLRGRSRERA